VGGVRKHSRTAKKSQLSVTILQRKKSHCTVSQARESSNAKKRPSGKRGGGGGGKKNLKGGKGIITKRGPVV